MRMPPVLDITLAAALVAAGNFEIITGTLEGADPALVLVSLLVGAVALLARGDRPLVCLGVLVALVVVDQLPGIGPFVTASLAVALLFALGSVGWRCADRYGIAVAVATVGLLVVVSALGPVPSDAVVWLFGTGAAWVAGRLLRREATRNTELTALAQELAAERDTRARHAVSAERTRIARELHDAVAHTVSVMTLQAGGVRRQLDADPHRVRERDVLLQVERLGRDAVEELHKVVGVLRTDSRSSGGVPLAPQPRLADVGELATRVCAAGLPVEVHITGDPRPLPSGVELAAYRVIQEALTNSLKHAGQARARVEIGYHEAGLTLAVIDDGSSGTGSVRGPGHGLAGMRERIALYGGEVSAARRPGGGFAVQATIPAVASS